jgi:GMP synthase-like glutamine amidotransferase
MNSLFYEGLAMSTVTCFQHIDCEGPGSLGEILRSQGIKLKVLKPFQGDRIPEHLGDGLVVLGGPMGVYEESRYPWMSEELSAIRKCLETRRPILGICLGSQMLASAGGGQVYKGPQPEVGWYPVTLTREGHLDPLFLGLDETLTAFHWHGDTFHLGSGATRLAQSALYPNQAFRLGTNAYGFQFHLETTEEMIRFWEKEYASELSPQGGPIHPGSIEQNISSNAKSLRETAGKIFGRWAALL